MGMQTTSLECGNPTTFPFAFVILAWGELMQAELIGHCEDCPECLFLTASLFQLFVLLSRDLNLVTQFVCALALSLWLSLGPFPQFHHSLQTKGTTNMNAFLLPSPL